MTGGAAGRVLRALRGEILSGALPQGERLTEASLCARYDVSRVPVREALRTLAAEGFVQVRPNSGATVATISPDDAADLYAVRRTIEEITARRCAALVAAGRDEGLVAQLSEIVTTGLAAVQAGDTADLPALNTRFHLTMARGSGSGSLLSLYRQVADRIQWIYAANVDVQGERSWTEHRGILEAITAGDEAAAATRAAAHIANSRRGFLQPGRPERDDGGMTDEIDPTAAPSGPGCTDCDAIGGWWVHLRRCARCGHVGCCDTSPAQHATAHYRATGHPLVRSFEPGESWYWDYRTETALQGPELAEPQHRPPDQPVPGPAGRVPADWRRHIH